MANLLNSPAQWNDGSQSPPAAWDGAAYVVSVASNTEATLNIRWDGSVVSGDTVSGSIQFDNKDGLDGYLVLVNSSYTEVLDSIPLVVGGSVDFSFDSLEANMRLVVSHGVDFSGSPPSPYYGLNVTVTPGAPVIPDPYVVRGTHRAYMGADSKQTAWIRDEAGRHDLTAYESLSVEVKRPGRDRPELTLDAEGSASGQLTFTVTANGAGTRLRPGLFYLYAKGDGRVVYTGLLEMLA